MPFLWPGNKSSLHRIVMNIFYCMNQGCRIIYIPVKAAPVLPKSIRSILLSGFQRLQQFRRVLSRKDQNPPGRRLLYRMEYFGNRILCFVWMKEYMHVLRHEDVSPQSARFGCHGMGNRLSQESAESLVQQQRLPPITGKSQFMSMTRYVVSLTMLSIDIFR